MTDSNLNPQPLPPQQPQYGQQVAPAAPRWNTMAIVAFIVTFFINIVGIILGFIALNQIKRTGEQGRGLALAAIIIGFVSIVLGIIIIISVFASVGSAMHSTY